MSGFDSRLVHSLVIERPTDGAVDDWNQPAQTWATLSEVPGLVQPKTTRNSVSEVVQLNDAGATLSTYTIFLRPTEIQPSDRVRVADGAMAGTYEIDGVRNPAGLNHHLECDARQVAV